MLGEITARYELMGCRFEGWSAYDLQDFRGYYTVSMDNTQLVYTSPMKPSDPVFVDLPYNEAMQPVRLNNAFTKYECTVQYGACHLNAGDLFVGRPIFEHDGVTKTRELKHVWYFRFPY